MKVLVVEDDPGIGKSLHRGFTEAGHECVWVRDGRRGAEEANSYRFDAIVLDLLLPEIPGLTVLRQLRAGGVRVPVIVLTALGSVEERVTGLNAGADDYLVKPFAFAELLARVDAIRRRSTDRPAPCVSAGELCLDLTTRRVTRGGVEVSLTPTEFSLLELLLRYAGQVVTRRMLCEHLWESDWEGATNVLEVHVKRLRDKLEREGHPSLIHTVRGRGYALEPSRRLFASLRFRLTFWNTVVILLLLAAVLTGVREGLRYALLRELDQLLADDAREVALAAGRYHPDWTQVTGMLERKAESHRDRGWFAQVFRPDGSLQATSSTAPVDTLPPPGRSQSRLTVEPYRLTYQSLDLPGELPLVVRIGSHLAFIRDDLSRLTDLVLLAGAAVLVVAPVSGYWLAGRATRPLAAIIRTTARLRPNRLDERLPLRGTGDELDQLSATINRSLDRIADHIEQQRDFVAHAAHELRSPLTALRTAIEVALERDRNAEEYGELLADLAEQCEGLSTLINRLLLLAEGDAGVLRPGAETVALGKLADGADEIFRAVAEQHGVSLLTAIGDPAWVRGDAAHLRRVILNLLDNAIKFTPAGGTVRLDVAVERGCAILRVIDTGRGIPPTDLPHVFDRFFRGDRSRPAGGTGLGLSICRTIVRAYGGTIDLDSVLGQGTTATVILPLAPQI